MDLTILFTVLILGLVSLLLYKTLTAPKCRTKTDGTISFTYSKPPSVFQFYLRLLTSVGNFYKSSQLSSNQKIPQFEVIVEDARLSQKSLSKYMAVCKFSGERYKKEQPLTWNFASGLSLAGCIVTHPKFPLKPITNLIHIKQTISQLSPLEPGVLLKKRLVMGGGKVTERGTEIEGLMELYNGDSNTLVAIGKSTFLIPSKRGIRKEDPKIESIGHTKSLSFHIPSNAGIKYANVSGDYNPWHISTILAKLFGFKKAIAQGYYSANRCLAALDELPPYPLHLEIEWVKPLFMPSQVKFTERKSHDGNKIIFDLVTEEKHGQTHLNLIGSIQHVPDLKLNKTTYFE